MTVSSRLGSLLVALMLVVGCGQKGPLYLPGNPSDMRTPVPASNAPAQPATSTSEDDEPDDPDEQR